MSSNFLIDCSNQLHKLFSIYDDSIEISKIIENYLMSSQHVMKLFKLSNKEHKNTKTEAVNILNIMVDFIDNLKCRLQKEFID